MSTLPNGKVAFSPTATYTLSNKAFGPDSTLSIDNSQGRGMTMHMVRSSGAPGPLAFTVKPSAGMADHFNLCTTHTASGSDNPETVCLDVFGNDKSKPHLASQAAVTGQQWRVQPAKGVQDAYRLSNAFSGDDVFMDVTPTGDADGKVDGAGGPGQLWVFNEVSGAQAAGTPGSNGTAGASGVIGPTATVTVTVGASNTSVPAVPSILTVFPTGASITEAPIATQTVSAGRPRKAEGFGAWALLALVGAQCLSAAFASS